MGRPALPYPAILPARPLVLFARSEAAQDVFATAPDGPPHRFRWRRGNTGSPAPRGPSASPPNGGASRPSRATITASSARPVAACGSTGWAARAGAPGRVVRPRDVPVSGYVELGATTNFSFLRGASHPQEYVVQAAAYGLAGIGIADRNTVAGLVRAHSAALQMAQDGTPIRFLPGVRLVTEDGFEALTYPMDREAWGRLCRLLTAGNRRVRKGECRFSFTEMLDAAEGQVFIALPTGAGRNRKPASSPASKPWPPPRGAGSGSAPAIAAGGRAAAPAAPRRDRPPLGHADGGRGRRPLPPPGQAPVAGRADLHPRGLHPRRGGLSPEANAERHLKPEAEMARLFRDHPEALARTAEIAAHCDFELSQLHYEYPDEPVPPGRQAQEYLAEKTWHRARYWRYPDGIPNGVEETLKTELAFIAKMKFAHYFLTISQIVDFARDKGILCQGRGSAANSAVCFCLGITAVDPSKHRLLFARFISENRGEPPDIDVDFEHERREEVIQHLYERYGRERAALCSTVIHYRPRMAIREVAKVLGLSEDVAASVADTVWGSWGKDLPDAHVMQAGLDPANPALRQALNLALQLIGFPRHLSQHVGGFVLTRGRLDETVPVGNAAMPDRTFIEWDKDDIDVLGLMKVDVLALGMLTCLKRGLDFLKRDHGVDYPTLADLPSEDPATYAMLSKADSVGVFQVESRAQMSMLPRLKPKEFYDLVVQVAIVRPARSRGTWSTPT